MGRRSSGFLEYNTYPVSRSSRMADAASIAGGWSPGGGVCKVETNGEGEPTGGTGVGGGVAV